MEWSGFGENLLSVLAANYRGVCFCLQAFENTYKREFGFVLESRVIMVDDVRVRGMGKVEPPLKSDTILNLAYDNGSTCSLS